MRPLTRFLTIGVLLAGVAAAFVDLQRPASQQWLVGIAVGGIHLYQGTLSPLVALEGFACRFEPTCSRYAEAVITREGLWRGGKMSLERVIRCGPWTPMGTVDRP